MKALPPRTHAGVAVFAIVLGACGGDAFTAAPATSAGGKTSAGGAAAGGSAGKGTSATGGASGKGGTGGVGAGAGGGSGGKASGTGGGGAGNGGTSGGGGAGAAGKGSAGAAGSGTGGGVATAGTPCSPPNATACAGHAQKVVLFCDPSTNVWVVATVCAGQQLCDTSTGPTQGSCQDPIAACKGKTAGAIVCDGATLTVCGPDLVTATTTACASVQHCALHAGNACAVCLDGDHQCKGAELEQCKADHSGYAVQEMCASSALCNETTGSCTAQVCTPDKKTCKQNELFQCSSDGSKLVSTKVCPPGTCDAQHGGCDVCTPNALACSMTDPKAQSLCASDGLSASEMPCPVQTPFCTGQGVCVACVDASTCAAPMSPCQQAVCTNGTCGVQPVADTTVIPDMTPLGDCKKSACSNGVVKSAADASDLPPPDMNPCHTPACVGTMPVQQNNTAPCGTNLVCMGGMCVCDCPNGVVAGMLGCRMPAMTTATSNVGGPADDAVDGDPSTLFHPGGFNVTLTATFPGKLHVTGIELDITGLGGGAGTSFAIDYTVIDPATSQKVGSLSYVHANGDHLKVPIPVQAGDYGALRIIGAPPMSLPPGTAPTDVAIYEITFAQCG